MPSTMRFCLGDGISPWHTQKIKSQNIHKYTIIYKQIGMIIKSQLKQNLRGGKEYGEEKNQ